MKTNEAARPVTAALLASAWLSAAVALAGCAASAPDQQAAKANNAVAHDDSAATFGPTVVAPVTQAQHTNSCTAPMSMPHGSCARCSVSCGEKQASCTAGEEWPGGSTAGSCLKSAVCECH
jgi:hypothetical protein